MDFKANNCLQKINYEGEIWKGLTLIGKYIIIGTSNPNSIIIYL